MLRLALALALTAGVAAAQECNIQMMQGTYVVTYEGWLAVPTGGAVPAMLPGVIMGVLSINGGTISGTATVIAGGDKAEYEAAPGGTVNMKSDCTGTMTLKMKVKGSTAPASTEIDRFVFLREDREIRVMIDTLGIPAVPMVLGTWKRISPVANMATW